MSSTSSIPLSLGQSLPKPSPRSIRRYKSSRPPAKMFTSRCRTALPRSALPSSTPSATSRISTPNGTLDQGSSHHQPRRHLPARAAQSVRLHVLERLLHLHQHAEFLFG